MTGMQGSRHRARLAFVLVTLFLDMAGFGMVAPILPLYVQRYAGGAFLAGVLGSVYAAMQVASAPLIGSLSDRFGRRRLLVACLLGTSCAYLALGFAESLGMVFAAVAFGGLLGGSYAAAQAFIADGTDPSNRTRWMGLAGAAVGLGVAAGPVIGGLLGSRGLRLPAIAASGVALSNAVLGIAAVREIGLPGGQASEKANLRVSPVAGILDLLLRPGLRPSLLALAALNLSFAGLPATFPLFSQGRFGWTPSRNGMFFAFIGACAVLTQGVLVGRAARWLGERHLGLAGAALAAGAFPFAAAARASWVLFPSLGIVAVGTGLAIPCLMSLVAHAAPENSVGRVMGGVQSVLGGCLVAGPILAGALHQALSPAAPYWMGAGFAAAALAILASRLVPPGEAEPLRPRTRRIQP